MALLAALLGWMFDGFEMGVFPLLARPALIDMLGLEEEAALAAKADDASVKQAAKKRLDARIGPSHGRISAAFLVGAAAGGWVFGWLGDRIGRVRAMIFSVLTYSVFTGLGGLAQNPWQLGALRFTAALGMGGEWALGVALVMESWPARARPVLAGFIGAAANLGFALTGGLFLALGGLGLQVSSGGWRWLMGICAFPALLTFFIRLFVPESERWRQAVKVAPPAGLGSIFGADLRRRTILAAVICGVPLLVTWGVVLWVPLWVGQMTEMTESQQNMNLAQIVSALGAVAGAFCGAVLGNLVSRRLAYSALCVGALSACWYLFGLHQRVNTPFFIAVGLVGALSAAFYGWIPLYLRPGKGSAITPGGSSRPPAPSALVY
jgi:MFS family permease